MDEDDPLEDFDPREITLDGVTKVVHVAGTGPAVIVMTEMPGISPQVARFSRWVRDGRVDERLLVVWELSRGSRPELKLRQVVTTAALHHHQHQLGLQAVASLRLATP
jgi:hypothetical protein